MEFQGVDKHPWSLGPMSLLFTVWFLTLCVCIYLYNKEWIKNCLVEIGDVFLTMESAFGTGYNLVYI